jgi:hypothetical protein
MRGVHPHSNGIRTQRGNPDMPRRNSEGGHSITARRLTALMFRPDYG